MKKRDFWDALWNVQWRCTDELIHRKGSTINKVHVKRKGGYYNVQDIFTKMKNEELQRLRHACIVPRQRIEKNADT